MFNKKSKKKSKKEYFLIFFRQRKFKKFIKEQKREIEELTSGDEDFFRFVKDSRQLFKNFFIPNDGNNNQPKALRPKSIVFYIVLAVLVKITVTGFLFASYPSPAELSAIVSSKMIELTNLTRTEAGLEPLTENSTLSKYAMEKGQDMLKRNYFAHDTPDGRKPWEWIDKDEYDYVYAGENLAMDFVSAEVVHDAFLKSPSHRNNILNSKYNEIGVAVLQGELGDHQTTLLVKFYGTQRKDVGTLTFSGQVNNTVESPDEVDHQKAIAGAANTDIAQNETTQPNNQGIIVVSTSQKTSKTLVDLVIEYSNIFFIAFLIFILISLALNFFIKIHIQHSSLIIQGVVVVALLTSMILVKFHFVETVAPQLLIL